MTVDELIKKLQEIKNGNARVFDSKGNELENIGWNTLDKDIPDWNVKENETLAFLFFNN